MKGSVSESRTFTGSTSCHEKDERRIKDKEVTLSMDESKYHEIRENESLHGEYHCVSIGELGGRFNWGAGRRTCWAWE